MSETTKMIPVSQSMAADFLSEEQKALLKGAIETRTPTHIDFEFVFKFRIKVPPHGYNPFENPISTSTRLKVMGDVWAMEFLKNMPALGNPCNQGTYLDVQCCWGKFVDEAGMKVTPRDLNGFWRSVPNADKQAYKPGTSLYDILKDGWKRHIDFEQTAYEAAQIGHTITHELWKDFKELWDKRLEADNAVR